MQAPGIFCYRVCTTEHNKADRTTKYKFGDVLNAMDEVGVLDVANLFQFCIFSE